MTPRSSVTSLMRAARTRANRRQRDELRRNADTNDETVGAPPVNRPCHCESCKLKKFNGGSKLQHAVIESYSFKPSYTYHKVPNDPFNYFLGVELETDENGSVSSSVAADMKRPYDFWIAKSDSSVSGPEFASHPATLSWWKANRSNLEEMFTMLLHADFSSHNGNQCGMHINISRNAFANPRHFYRFLTLIHKSPRWSIKMSQRTEGSANSWAKLGVHSKNMMRMIARNDEETDKYVALNVPYEPDAGEYRRRGRWDANGNYVEPRPRRRDRSKQRYEFRLPRGTLRIDRFFKNLEWTVAMIEYTRTRYIVDVTPVKFMKWVRNNAETYPDLAAFIAEKFEGRVSA